MDASAGPTFSIDDDGRENQKDGSVPRVTERLHQFLAADDSSESSSSIGTPDDSGEDEEEMQSGLNGGIGLGSLDSLEDSLPIKKGLSGHFAGKSKSFTDLSQVNSVKELQKQENPFNKRRRVLMAYKRSSFYAWSNPKSMPLLPLHEQQEEEEQEQSRKPASPSSLSSSSSSSLTEEKKQEDQMLLRRRQKAAPESTKLKPGKFKLRSLSLADLKEHDDDEEEEEDA